MQNFLLASHIERMLEKKFSVEYVEGLLGRVSELRDAIASEDPQKILSMKSGR